MSFTIDTKSLVGIGTWADARKEGKKVRTEPYKVGIIENIYKRF